MTIPVIDLSCFLVSGEVSRVLVENQLYGHGVPHKQYLACSEVSVEYRLECLSGKHLQTTIFIQINSKKC